MSRLLLSAWYRCVSLLCMVGFTSVYLLAIIGITQPGEWFLDKSIRFDYAARDEWEPM